MSSTIHDSKLRLASIHSQVSDLSLSVAGLQIEATTEEYEEEDSPFAEVRASVSNMDVPDMPILTFRMWLIGIFLNVGSAAANTFFNFRNPQIYVISLPILCVDQSPIQRPFPEIEALTLTLPSSHYRSRLLAYPLGRLAAAVLPIRQYDLPKPLGGGQFSLNPGS